MKTVFLTAVGGDIGQGVASIVREIFADWRIVGADMGERHGGGLFVDKLLVAPPSTAPHYLEWLTTSVAAERADFCLPLSEAEIGFLAQRRLADIGGVPIVTPGFKAIDIGSDKFETSRFIASIGLPGPWTVKAEDFDACPRFPAIYKPRRGAGSKAVFLCRSQEDAIFYSQRHPGGIFQEQLLPDDREVTCAVYRTRQGDIGVLQLMRTLVGGFTGWAQVIEDEAITAQCRQLAEALNLAGSINIQLRLTENGPRIFEINPRFSSTSLIRHKMGFQDVVWTLQEHLGLPVTLTSPPRGLIGVRVQGAAILSDNE